MFQVSYIEKIPKGPKGENVERRVRDTTRLDKPESYKDFINKIAERFKIPKKNIELICLNNDGDDFGINNDVDLQDNIDEAREFHVFFGSGAEEKPKKENPPSEELNSSKKIELKKDEQKEEDDDDDEYKIKIDVDIDIKDNEIEDIINSQIKEIKIDDNLNDVVEFNKDKYKENLEKQTASYINNFKTQFDEKTKKIYEEKTEILKSSIIKLMDTHSKSQINIIKKLSNDTSALNDGFSTIVNDTNEMNLHMGKLKENMENKPNIIIKKDIKVKDRENDRFNTISMLEEDDEGNNNNNNNNNNNKSKELKVKFLKEVIENEELMTKCKNIIIDNIKIQNIGNKTLKNLYFIRDENESSKDFIIAQNKNINSHKLSPTGEEFSNGKIESHSITLSINNPKENETYNMYLYVREKENGENISKPLKIVYKIKEDEEAVIRKRDEEERQKAELEKQKELERQKAELEKQKELERQKEELEKQKELERQKEELEKKELEKQRLELEKQKELERQKIKIRGEGQLDNNDGKINYEGLNPEEVNTIFEELENEYNLSSILDKEKIIGKIIELKCDRGKINDWIDEVM